MPTNEQKNFLTKAITQIRLAEQALVTASRATADPIMLHKIAIEYNNLDSFLSQLLHVLAIADDAIFASATASLKQQAGALQVDKEELKKICSDVEMVAAIVGYITQAIAFIMKL